MTRLILSVTLGMALLSGCVSQTVKSTSVPVLDTPTTLAPEAELLDVGVVILDPGISAEEDEELVYPEVRKAEATFMATELAEVLAEQGGWGAVRLYRTTGSSPICWCAARYWAPTGNLWS